MKRFAFALVCALSIPLPALSAEPVYLGEIAVTATRTEKRIEEIPAAIDVVTSEEVRESRGFGIGEVIETLPGVQSGSKNGGYDSHIIIRGAGAQADYGVRQIMIMVDGIPITDPDSFTRLDPVDVSLIERIEVVKGPNSTLYGANAAGGVINIITRDGLKDAGLSLRAAYGSYDTQNYNLSYGGGDELAYFLSLSHRSSEGWREHNSFETFQANAKLSYSLGTSSEVSLHLSSTEADFELPGTLTKAEFEADPSQNSSSWPDMARDSYSRRAALEYSRDLSAESSIKAQAYYQYWSHYHPVYAGINDGGADTYGLEVTGIIGHELFGKKASLTTGASASLDDYSSDKFQYADINPGFTGPFTSSERAGALMSRTGSIVKSYGVFIEEEVRPVEKVIVSAGVRYDNVSYDVDESTFTAWKFSPFAGWRYVASPSFESVEKEFTHVSPRVGVTWLATDTASLFASVSTGFQTPTRSEIVKNRELVPSKTLNYEAGVKARPLGKHRADLTFFYAKLEDEIIKVPNPDVGSTDSFFENAGESTHRGVEAAAEFEIAGGLWIGGAYTYSDFTFDEFIASDGSDFSGNALPLVPRHQYSSFIRYAHGSGFSARVGTNTWGSYWVDEANTEKYEGFTTVDARVAYEKGGLSLSLNMENILDEEYAVEVTKSRGALGFSPGAPMTFMAGIGYRF